ncbi:MAG TPA: 5-formyltetrahydrofolate cyclo-ligase [Acidimicrobiia bacterium]
MDKAEIRRVVGEMPPITPEASRVIAGHLFDFLSARLPGTIATYRAMPDEVDVGILIDRLPGWNWVLPRVEEDRSLTWRDARVSMESHRWGMEQPQAKGPTVSPFHIDLFLVPGLGFDSRGNRIGRGGGYYDRELAMRRPDVLTIGVTVENRVFDELPVDLHDQPITHLVTELGVREPTPRK